MKLKERPGIFLLLLLTAVVLRFGQLGNIPPGLNRDEASLGYTAYSILKTGRDEYGNFLPLNLESFGDWKLPLYTYLDLPLIAVFGLNEVSVRLLSALVGLGTLLTIFWLARYLAKPVTGPELAGWIGLTAGFFLAFNPWHFHFSRVAYEANLALFLVVLALVCFGKGLKSPGWLVPAGAFFGLTLFTYHAAHLFLPLFLPGLLWFGWGQADRRQLKASLKVLVLATGLFLLLGGLALGLSLGGSETTKISGLHLWGDPVRIHLEIDLPRGEHPNPPVARLLHNKLIFAVQEFSLNVLRSFSPEFLFAKGGANHAHNIRGFGNLLLIEALPLTLGLIFLVRSGGKLAVFLFWWLLAAVIPAAITRDAPHTARMIFALPPLIMIEAIGLVWALRAWQNVKPRFFRVGLFVFMLGYLVNLSVFLDGYLVHFPQNEAGHWGYGYRKLNEFIYQNGPFAKVVMEHPDRSPYIFLLFAQKYDPARFQREVERYPPTEEGFVHVKNYGNFEFVDRIDWADLDRNPNTLAVVWAEDYPDRAKDKTNFTINDPRGKPLLILGTSQPEI